MDLENNWSKIRNIKRLCERKKIIMQILKKNEVEFISDLCLLDLPLAFYKLKVPGWVIQLLAAPPVSPSLSSRGGFCCDQEGGTPGSPLGGTVQFFWKIVCVPPAPSPPTLVCPNFFPIMYSFWWIGCPFQGRGQSLYGSALSCLVLMAALCVSWDWPGPWFPLAALISDLPALLASGE